VEPALLVINHVKLVSQVNVDAHTNIIIQMVNAIHATQDVPLVPLQHYVKLVSHLLK
jgi:hypothetical protein